MKPPKNPKNLVKKIVDSGILDFYKIPVSMVDGSDCTWNGGSLEIDWSCEPERVLHELAHWIISEKREDRNFGLGIGDEPGRPSYADDAESMAGVLSLAFGFTIGVVDDQEIVSRFRSLGSNLSRRDVETAIRGARMARERGLFNLEYANPGCSELEGRLAAAAASKWKDLELGAPRGKFDLLENTGEGPEQEPVRFYKATTNYSLFREHPDAMVARMLRVSEAEGRRIVQSRPEIVPKTPDEFYDSLESQRTNAIEKAAAASESAWHDALEPEYKAWPAAIAALAATKIEIGCEHFRLPFSAIAIRLPHDFVQEPGGPVIHSVFATVLRNLPEGGSVATTSWDAAAPPRARPIEMTWMNLGERVPAVFSVMLKWKELRGPFEDDSFFLASIGLVPGETIDDRLKKVEARSAEVLSKGTVYVPSLKLMREMFSLAIGVSFMATGRMKKEKPIVAKDKKPRAERRRFEKEHDGESQPTFSVGRDLILPREEGVASPKEAGETGPGEGEGRQLKYGHMRCGHLRFQPYGPRTAPTYDLIFLSPTLVRSDLPIKPKSTPSKIEDVGGAFDVTEPSA
jgi:hypothetical protein